MNFRKINHQKCTFSKENPLQGVSYSDLSFLTNEVIDHSFQKYVLVVAKFKALSSKYKCKAFQRNYKFKVQMQGFSKKLHVEVISKS